MRWLQVISQQICVKIETTVKATLLLFDCVLPGGINNLIKLMFSVKPRGPGAGSNYTNPANDPKTQPNDLSAVENISKTVAEEPNKDVLSANKDSCESPAPGCPSLTMWKVYSFASCKKNTRFHFHHDGNFNNAVFVPPGLFSALP